MLSGAQVGSRVLLRNVCSHLPDLTVSKSSGTERVTLDQIYSMLWFVQHPTVWQLSLQLCPHQNLNQPAIKVCFLPTFNAPYLIEVSNYGPPASVQAWNFVKIFLRKRRSSFFLFC
jgi:hypothetical protein